MSISDQDTKEKRVSSPNIVHNRSFKTPSTDAPTRHLFVANCGRAAGISDKRVIELFSRLAAADLQLPDSKRSILFASFRTVEQAQHALDYLLSPAVREEYRKFTVKYAELSQEEEQEQVDQEWKSLIDCMSILLIWNSPKMIEMYMQAASKEEQHVFLETSSCNVPGLRLLLDFVDASEEQVQ